MRVVERSKPSSKTEKDGVMVEPKSELAQLIRYVAGIDMSTDIDLFHFDGDRPNFESLATQNGFTYWLASQLKDALGYTTMAPIRKAVNNAMAACAQLGIPINENFQEIIVDGKVTDWKLSRFACYLTVMNGDSRNRSIAQAQAYFITMAEAFRQYVQESENVERILIRGELSDKEKSLSNTASQHGVEKYALFQNSGYRGMYNMDTNSLRHRKGVPSGRSPLDFMGKDELAANLFRLSQTEAKIRNEGIKGQKPLEVAAERVGRGVRDTMFRLSGSKPEDLPPAQDIREVKKGLKRSRKEYEKLDKPK